jgi:DNA-binding MarR family transcriptional regulator
MTRKISGTELRHRLLSRIGSSHGEASEVERIEALAPAGHRELLVVIAQLRPRSVTELAKLVGRHQPNVSRGLAALARADLLRLVPDGRTSVPSLTEEGVRKASELAGEIEVRSLLQANKEASAVAAPIFHTEFENVDAVDLRTDEVFGLIRLNFERKFSSSAIDLNEIALRIVRNWWPMLYRRDDPFPICSMTLEDQIRPVVGRLLIRSLGARVEFVVRAEDEAQSNLLSVAISEHSMSEMLRDRLLKPVSEYLERGRRLDRPLHAQLRRLEDVLQYPQEVEFAKTAGALGVSPHGISGGLADGIHRLIEEMPEENTRLDFASSTLPDTFEAELNWSRDELRARRKTNALGRLAELKMEARHGGSPWRTGKSAAQALRRKMHLRPDASIGGIDGLRGLLDAKRFEVSMESSGPLLGYRGSLQERPVIIVRDMGPNGNAFLLARAVGDYLTHNDREAPITDVHSDRQAVGRAFAAEFLAPSNAVVGMIEHEKKTKAWVAAHFGVDTKVIAHQYENNASR